MIKTRTIGKTYWYVFLNGKLMVRTSRDNDDSTHRIRFSTGNYFNSAEDAETMKETIANLLEQYRGRMERKSYPYGSAQRYTYWHLFIKELVPCAFSADDRDRLIDNNRAMIGNYLNKDDAKSMESQLKQLFGYNK